LGHPHPTGSACCSPRTCIVGTYLHLVNSYPDDKGKKKQDEYTTCGKGKNHRQMLSMAGEFYASPSVFLVKTLSLWYWLFENLAHLSLWLVRRNA
jgi:hypothetical protein